jgi:hypothetical protein
MTLQINFWTILPLLTRRHQCNPPRESRGEEAGSRSHLLRRKTDSPSQRHLPLGRGHSRCPRVWYLIGYSILGIACGAVAFRPKGTGTPHLESMHSRHARHLLSPHTQHHMAVGAFLASCPDAIGWAATPPNPMPNGPPRTGSRLQSECPTHLPHDSFVPCRPPSETECGVSPRCPFPGLVGGDPTRHFVRWPLADA